MSQRKKILVAPLDWGLGHAARCIPVINELLKQNAEVLIAADGRALDLLKKEFPQLGFYRLKGYEITYGEKNSIAFSMFAQLPKLTWSVFREHNELKKIIEEQKIDAVISDNRYGLFSKKIPCIFITHQLGIIMPTMLKWVERIIYKLNKRIINQFTQCWIPDFDREKNLPGGRQGLSGILSQKYPLPVKAHFIGTLSRFEIKEDVQKEYDVLVILSGPEPQRTVLENLLIEQLKSLQLKTLIVQGIPEGRGIKKNTEYLSVVPFLNAQELNQTILGADIIISRSGYSTIMDLSMLGKNAILIPTPGQTEQEYLADYFLAQRIFYSEKQNELNLQRALIESRKYSGLKINSEKNNLLQQKISELLKMVK